MENQSDAQQAASSELPSQPEAVIEVKPDEALAALLHSTVDGLLRKAQADAEAVAGTRDQTATAKEEIERHLNSARETVAGLTLQVEAARGMAADVSNLATSVQTANQQAKDTVGQTGAALESARAHVEAASKSAAAIESLKTQVEQTAQVVAARSEHVEEGRKHADGVRATIDRLFTQAQQSATNADAQHQAARSTADNLNNLFASAQTVKANTDSIAESVAATRATVESHSVTTKRLAELAGMTEERVAQYELRLKELIEESAKQRKIIDELLLGATNAGLASAWDKRGKTFKPDEILWQRVFVGSLAGLLGLAIWQAWAHGSMTQPPDWQQLARMLVFKVPLLVPLIWLAIHAARQAAFAKRMEEEYAFKATTSMSFEGYRRQMAEIGKDLAGDSPLAQLCNNTLRAIAAPPGKVYDKQRMDPTPGTAAAEIIGPVVDGVTKTLVAKLPDFKS